jgi:hypothetical protein
VLGSIGYDFGSEARRDSFKQLMPAVEIDDITVSANPYDARQLVNYLAENPSEHKSLIWTINQELNPIYAIEVISYKLRNSGLCLLLHLASLLFTITKCGSLYEIKLIK